MVRSFRPTILNLGPVKRILASTSDYAITHDDRLLIDVFESLACHEHCIDVGGPQGGESLPRIQVIAEARMDRMVSHGLDDQDQ